jgi:hypothetical protein
MSRLTAEWTATNEDQAIPAMICTFCKKDFERAYRICAKRAARPQFCSMACYGLHHAEKSAAVFADKFWARLAPANEFGCREWTGRTYMRYGLVDLDGRPQMAHRIAYHLSTGQEPGELSVCHACDNPPCCEPAHLWLGTHKENMVDMAAKGRTNAPSFLGESHPGAKLKRVDITAIRSSGLSNADIAKLYNVTPENIRRIRIRETWKHV